mgnify:FL=1
MTVDDPAFRLAIPMKSSTLQAQPNLVVFHVSCWIMGLIAFVQLMTVGAAMAFRTSSSATPEAVTRVVKEYVTVELKAPIVAQALELKGLTQAEMRALLSSVDEASLGESETLSTSPMIADPVIERLVNDARSARIASDNVAAMTKLEEAYLKEPKNSHVLYEMAVTFETMGINDTAADYYVKVFQLGPKAGSLFKKAASKIAKGLETNVTGLASLGAVRKMLPQKMPEGERRGITLSIAVAPGREFDPMLLQPTVHFFEKVDGKVVGANVEESELGRGNYWMDQPVNYQDGEEMVEVWYLVRNQDARGQFILGERKFYGFIAELYYDGKLVDIVPQPRTLSVEMLAQKVSGDPSWDPELDRLLKELEDRGAGDSILPQMPSDNGSQGR